MYEKLMTNQRYVTQKDIEMSPLFEANVDLANKERLFRMTI